jgi:hypothetical protein
MEGMISYTQAAMERTMKVQEVILRAVAKKITWWQAAEIIGISDRQMRRWHERGTTNSPATKARKTPILARSLGGMRTALAKGGSRWMPIRHSGPEQQGQWNV